MEARNKTAYPTPAPAPVVWWPYRTIFYAICSFYMEVVWTAVYEFVASGMENLTLRGYSSIWSLFIYGVSLTLLEKYYFYMRRRGFNTLLRGLVYTLSSFAVELAFGLILKPWNANSWDYSNQFTYHLAGGMIALEYAPLWFFSGLLFEYQIDVCNRVQHRPPEEEQRKEAVSSS